MPYLDYAASAPLRAEALQAMLPFLERPAGNAASQHGPGRAARAAVETAREQVAALVGAAPGEVVFTSGGTEADNLAVKGAVLHRAGPAARHLVCSAVEHHAVLDAAAWAEADAGARVALAPVDAVGRVDLGGLAGLLEPGRTALVAVMAANNEVGTGQPVAAAAELAHAAGALLLCDAVQAAGLPGVDMRHGIDLLALASHKLGGPTGVGALVVRSGAALRPLLHGGGQERGLRSGTLPVAAIAGFGAAAEATIAEREAGAAADLAALRDRLLAALRTVEPGLVVNGEGPLTGGSRPTGGAASAPSDRGTPPGFPGPLRPDPPGRVGPTVSPDPPGAPAIPGLPGLLSVRFPGRLAEDLLLLLDRLEVACSAGSACASGAVAPSHVLLAMGRSPAAARETVRFSLGHASTTADVDAAVVAVRQALQVLAPSEAVG
jgi:cysteine desulfurase